MWNNVIEEAVSTSILNVHRRAGSWKVEAGVLPSEYNAILIPYCKGEISFTGIESMISKFSRKSVFISWQL